MWEISYFPSNQLSHIQIFACKVRWHYDATYTLGSSVNNIHAFFICFAKGDFMVTGGMGKYLKCDYGSTNVWITQ